MVQGSLKGLRSGALAKAAGVSPDTLRHYEKVGILPRAARTESGYRVYPPNTPERIVVVQRALRIGFTLAELGEIFKDRDAGGAPCKRVYQLAGEKLQRIEAEIEGLHRIRRYLRKALSNWQERMERAGPGEKSHLLYSLSEATGEAETLRTSFRRKGTL
jgi:DNA-binding transcriptional MerR regulator